MEEDDKKDFLANNLDSDCFDVDPDAKFIVYISGDYICF